MTPETTEKKVAPIPGAGNDGNGKANKVSTSELFHRCGYIAMERSALKIVYESFGENRVAYIAARDVLDVQEPGAFPVNVQFIYDSDGDCTVIEKAGKAWRSRSGRALMIRTVDSDGEIMVPWSKFKQVIADQVAKAHVSRITTAAKSQPVRVVSDITTGLQRCF
ncbi:MAG TPA: hypothetical protein PK272_06545 [Methanoregulaceae archaeon]|nr:hypothetical protein [Methanoregulaceae archaeon]HNI42315.1 hypothetical protein [Methanoregulaceae archaeon]